jgi:ribonuclease HII
MSCRLTGLVAGLDEAGRAPLAGPVVSSCVIWESLPSVRAGINDSKLLTEKQRVELFGWILQHAYKVAVGMASTEEIESLNIHNASLLSMERAARNTAVDCDLLLVDGLFPLKSFPVSRAVVHGDRRCFFIAAASIVAKVVRDYLMDGYHARYPQYLWKKNKGYPTAEHRKAIEVHGVSPVHRRTFKGVREFCLD